MNHRGKTLRQGLTMIELIVVMAIIAVLAAVAVPGFARLGLFARDELNGSAREVYAMLRAAKLYAATYRVNTAVVYMLDNYKSSVDNPQNTAGLSAPITDSISGGLARVIVGASIMYQLRDSGSRWVSNAAISDPALASYLGGNPPDAYVPVMAENGEFNRFQQDMVMLLLDPDNPVDTLTGRPLYLYASQSPRYSPPSVANPLASIGMTRVVAIPNGGPWGNGPTEVEQFPAHVFKPSGELDVDYGAERVNFLVAPSPALQPEDRVLNTSVFSFVQPDGSPNIVSRPIAIQKSYGRIEFKS